MDYITINEKRFGSLILQRGKKYFEDGLVTIRQKIDTTYFAVVHGTEDYHVHLALNDLGRVSSMSCNCPYAQGGHYCKHEAALLYAIQEQVDQENFKAHQRLQATDSNHAFSDFSKALETMVRFNPKTYLANASILLKVYGPKMSHEEYQDAKEKIIAESHFHGGYSLVVELADASHAYLKEEKDEGRLAFAMRLYKALPSFSSKAIFLLRLYRDQELKAYIPSMAKAHCFPGKEFDELVDWGKENENIFDIFDEDALMETARFSILGPQSKSKFLESCMKGGYDAPLMEALSHPNGAIRPEVIQFLQKYLQKSGNRKAYIALMVQQIQHRSVPFSNVLDFYKSLTPTEQAEQNLFLRKAFYYTNYETDVALLTSSDSFTTQKFLSLHLETIAACVDNLKNRGERFFLKPLIRRLDKGLKEIDRYDCEESVFLAFMQIIQGFSEYPEVEKYLRNDQVIAKSLEGSKIRKAYLEACLTRPSGIALRRF